MNKQKKSGPAIFIDCVIVITAMIAVLCFIAYYSGYFKNTIILWTGITAFTIMYHLWLRITMGDITKRIKVSHKWSWFKERTFEKKLYQLLQVKKWKDKALTYNPELFSLTDYSLEEVADTM